MSYVMEFDRIPQEPRFLQRLSSVLSPKALCMALPKQRCVVFVVHGSHSSSKRSEQKYVEDAVILRCMYASIDSCSGGVWGESVGHRFVTRAKSDVLGHLPYLDRYSPGHGCKCSPCRARMEGPPCVINAPCTPLHAAGSRHVLQAHWRWSNRG